MCLDRFTFPSTPVLLCKCYAHDCKSRPWFVCTKCDIMVKTKRGFETHLKSRAHLKAETKDDKEPVALLSDCQGEFHKDLDFNMADVAAPSQGELLTSLPSPSPCKLEEQVKLQEGECPVLRLSNFVKWSQ